MRSLGYSRPMAGFVALLALRKVEAGKAISNSERRVVSTDVPAHRRDLSKQRERGYNLPNRNVGLYVI